MRSIKVLQFKDFETSNDNLVNGWLDAVTVRLSFISQIGVPVASQIPNGQWGIFKDTSTGNIYLATNDNGTVKKVQLV